MTYDADSVAALIVTPEGGYVLQQREDRPDVDFPGIWGLFGGTIEPGEPPQVALERELDEELALHSKLVRPFSVIVMDERPHGGWHCRRAFYEVPVEASDVDGFVLREGLQFAIFSDEQVAALGHRIIPFDACAIAMHVRRELSRTTLARRRAVQQVTPL